MLSLRGELEDMLLQSPARDRVIAWWRDNDRLGPQTSTVFFHRYVPLRTPSANPSYTLYLTTLCERG